MYNCCHFPQGKCGLKLTFPAPCVIMIQSLPSGEVWIEISVPPPRPRTRRPSLPSGEVWIEIPYTGCTGCCTSRHFPQGKCGLKSVKVLLNDDCLRHFPQGKCGLKFFITSTIAAPTAMSLPSGEVWIEIPLNLVRQSTRRVTSLRGSVD